MVTVAELLERVQAATGPDRELDVLLECMAGDTHSHGHRPSTAHGKVVHYYNSSGRSGTFKASRYTLSVDDALDLVERKLPGWVCETLGQDAVGRLGEMRGIGWTAEFSNGLDTHQGQAPTLPLAILAAALSALIAKEPS